MLLKCLNVGERKGNDQTSDKFLRFLPQLLIPTTLRNVSALKRLKTTRPSDVFNGVVFFYYPK